MDNIFWNDYLRLNLLRKVPFIFFFTRKKRKKKKVLRHIFIVFPPELNRHRSDVTTKTLPPKFHDQCNVIEGLD